MTVRRSAVIAVVVAAAAASAAISVSAAPAVSQTEPTAAACSAPGREVLRPSARAAPLTEQWSVPAPPDDVTVDLTGTTSTAYPARRSPFAVGTRRAALRTCVVGGRILGRADDERTWTYYHDRYNAACLTVAARGWMQVRGLRCDNVEDGIRLRESDVGANDVTVHISGTHLTRIRDDCLENDYTVGGVVADSLWEQCNTGISERPWGGRSWTSPVRETLVLDHVLIGLYETPHEEDGVRVRGENALFKWSSSANRLVIRCSMFKVDSVSLNGPDAMAVPAGTVVDDSACPDRPSTLVWLGGGRYPASTGGLRVVTDPRVWSDAVSAWKAAHRS